MAITAEQRLERRNWIGSSDAPAILGVDPWKSRIAVFMEKVFAVDDLPNEGPIAQGNRWEGPLLDWAEESLGQIERNVHVRHPTDIVCAANLDGRLTGKKEGVEAKFTGLADEFGEEGTDQIPERVIVQAHHQMYCGGLELVWVPVLLARMGRPTEVMFRVERNDDLISHMIEEEHRFWESYVLPKIPPPLDGPPALDVIRRIRRTAGEVAPLDPDLVAAWETAKAIKKQAEDKEEEAKSALLASLGDAEIGDYGDPGKWLTYFEQKRAGYSVAPTKFRVARISKRT